MTRDEQERTSNCFESVVAPGATCHFLLQNLTVQPFLWPQINNWTIGQWCLTLQGVFAFVASFPSVWWLELFVIEGLLDGTHLLLEIIFLAEPGLTTNNWKFQRLLSIWEFEPKLWKAKLRFETLVFMIGYAKPSLKRIYRFSISLQFLNFMCAATLEENDERKQSAVYFEIEKWLQFHWDRDCQFSTQRDNLCCTNHQFRFQFPQILHLSKTLCCLW